VPKSFSIGFKIPTQKNEEIPVEEVI